VDNDKVDHKKIWGSGYFAGIRAADSLSYLGEGMNKRKYDKLELAQTMTARKILDCVPTQVETSKQDIYAIVKTLGISITLGIVEGCLYSLRDDGLVKEGRRGTFIRVVPTATVKKLKTVVKPEVPEVVPEPEVSDLVEESYTSVAVRDPIEIITDMTDCMNELMQKFELAALEISEYVEQSDKDVAKMKQLQALLSSLTD